MYINIIYSGPLLKYAEIFKDALFQEGHIVALYESIPSFKNKAEFHIILGPDFFNVKSIVGTKIGILTEQLPHFGHYIGDSIAKNWVNLKEFYNDYDLLITWTPAEYEFIKNNFGSEKLGYFPHGYLDYGSNYIPPENCQWDVAFLGTMSDRRKFLIDKIRSLGIKICPIHEAWDFDKTNLLQTSKLILNIHQNSSPPSFEINRIFDSASFEKPIVSETMNGSYNVLGNTVLQASYHDLPYLIRDVLNSDPYFQRELGRKIHTLTKKYPMTKLIQLIMEKVKCHIKN